MTEKDFTLMTERELPLWRMLALRILHNAADADDAVQSALFRCWKLRLIPGIIHNPAGYISTCVIHAAYAIRRKQIRERAKLETWEQEQPSDSNPIEFEQLDAALTRLPRRHRDVLEIAVLSGKNGEEAARLLGCSRNALYQKVNRAKTILKIELEKLNAKR